MVHGTRKQVEEAGDALSEEDKTQIENAVAELETAIKDESKEEIETKTQALIEASAKLMEVAQAKAAAESAAASGEPTDAGAAQPDEDVVDAEFEEVKDDDKK
jgi:molecular chaperone DnaK